MNHGARINSSKDVIGFLKGQHHQIKGIFEEVIAATGSTREKIFHDLQALMSAHETAEEKVVHPTAKHILRGGPAEVAARLAEETEAKKTLAALDKLDVESPEFETKIRELQSAVLAHAKSEEKEEFDKLQVTLAPAKLKDMRKDVEAVEARATKS